MLKAKYKPFMDLMKTTCAKLKTIIERGELIYDWYY